MLIFKDYIPDLLPSYFVDHDSYKDGSGNGFLVRFLEIFGEELDEEYYPKIDGVIDLKDVFNTPTGYLDYIAYLLGNLPIVLDDEEEYRNLLSFIVSIYQIKGTTKSYSSMLQLLSIDTAVVEIPIQGILYDDGSIYDGAGIIYDDECIPCSDYELILTNGPTLTADLYAQIQAMIDLIEPINATLSRLNYDGQDVSEQIITVTVDGNGDLVYNNAADPGLILTLDAAGNLLISGPQADRYYIDDNGDLIYILY